MKMVTIPESDLRFLLYWTYLTMPIVAWFAFKAATTLGRLGVALLGVRRKP